MDISNSRSSMSSRLTAPPTRGIDEVRELRESAKYQPLRDRFRVFIIDEVHMLTMEAFNALLKILEEPPPHVFFIFATTELRKVPATIVSRCHIFEFRAIPTVCLSSADLHHKGRADQHLGKESLQLIAVASEGGLRDALGRWIRSSPLAARRSMKRMCRTVLGSGDLEIMVDLCKAIASAKPAKSSRSWKRSPITESTTRFFTMSCCPFTATCFC